MMRALLDTDVVLDLFLDRKPFAEAAAELWELNRQNRYEGYVSAITPINVFYFARKFKGRGEARQIVAKLLAALPVCTVDSSVLRGAMSISFSDYEDAVQHASATASLLDAIVTRNTDDYKSSTLPVYTPTDFLRQVI